MKILPFRFKNFKDKTLITNELGEYGIFSSSILNNLFENSLSKVETTRLKELKIIQQNNWETASISNQLRQKFLKNNQIEYIIVIPTLRCNYTCSYCQVSRAAINANGYDWNKKTISNFKKFIKSLNSNFIKIEFQGGEPTLRIDILKNIIDFCLSLKKEFQFIICTNLSNLSEDFLELLKIKEVFISTSLDGSELITQKNRTIREDETNIFFKNLNYIINNFSTDKISALPTVTESLYDSPEELIDTYIKYGFKSIFLRPVNYMGFARKKYEDLSKDYQKWSDFYFKALEHILKINEEIYFEEYYLSLLLEKIFIINPKSNYVDFRSPNFISRDYLVIDYSGKIYPSDEARMLTRSGHIDLALGELGGVLDANKINDFNWRAINQVEPDCLHCSYMSFCGIDLIDDISRSNRIDTIKHDSWFCKRNMGIFDFIFQKIIDKDKKWLNLFSSFLTKTKNHNKTYEIFYDKASI